MLAEIIEKIETPEGVNVEIDGFVVKVKGSKGENQRMFKKPSIEIKKDGNFIVLNAKKPTKREKKMLFTFKAHIKNLLKGVNEGFVYKIKICSSHFPMSASVDGNKILIKNFFGEKVPRKSTILDGVTVKIEGDIITVEGIDKENTGQTAANLELATTIRNRDKRVFQDGCYIIEKDGKEIKS